MSIDSCGDEGINFTFVVCEDITMIVFPYISFDEKISACIVFFNHGWYADVIIE
jgi:hypothetical protein